MKIAVVIPSYNVKKHILEVLNSIGPEVSLIYVVDDCCPEASGAFVKKNNNDPRVRILTHDVNKGVGGAVKTGYSAAIEDGADIIVKLDGDGQMDPSLIPSLVHLIQIEQADYVKGNRFYSFYDVREMPAVRLFGNAALSFMTKLSSGYWSIFDPTNGFTAIHASVLERLEFANIADRYFFESDMLINLGGIRAVVKDMPMEATYGDEESGLKIKQIIGTFLWKNSTSYFKRIIYGYFLRDFSIASLHLLSGLVLFIFGVIFGLTTWYDAIVTMETAATGSIMLSALTVILGFQLLLSFLSYDIYNEPKDALQRFSRKGTVRNND